MSHATIENKTPFAFEAIYLNDEEGRPLLVTVVRATYEIRGQRLSLAEKQAPVSIAGELYGEDAGTSSYRYEPEIAFYKPATDMVLIGHACAPRGGTSEMDVSFQVGAVGKTVKVVGDRVWVRGGMTRPQPFERVPLVWERAFGGWDRSVPPDDKAELEPRNPVGTGFRSQRGSFQEGIRLPNLEAPGERLTTYGQVVTPVGFGFTSTSWQPRAALGGSYDATWTKERMPLLPKDFDRRFFSSAAPGLTAKGFLRGDEPVAILGASPLGQISFALPGAAKPRCTVTRAFMPDAEISTELDTIVVNTDDDVVFLTYRGHVVLRDGPHDVKTIRIAQPELPSHTAYVR